MKMAELPKDNDPYGGLGLFIALFPSCRRQQITATGDPVMFQKIVRRLNMIVKLSLKIILLDSIVSLLPSCTAYYEKKQLPGANYPRIDISGNTYAVLEHLIIDYESTINHEKRTITLEGKIKIIETALSNVWEIDVLNFHFYFMNEERYVLEKETLMIHTFSRFADDVFNFKETYEFNPEYKYITFGYEVKASG